VVSDRGGRPIPVARIKRELERLRAASENLFQPPVDGDLFLSACHPDLAPAADRQGDILQRIKSVYESVLQAYPEFVRRWFDRFARRMPHALMLPAKLAAVVYYAENAGGRRYCWLSWSVEPLPRGSTSRVEVSFGKAPTGVLRADSDGPRRTVSLFRELRPEASSRLPITTGGHNAVDFLFETDSATELVYDWLRSDLKAIGWVE
jgi:hypothetical protein